MMTDQQWKVTGMTCGHCEQSVTKNLLTVGGVTSVTIDLKPNETSEITTHSSVPLTAAQVKFALREAGSYQLVN
jgi:copper chaperone